MTTRSVTTFSAGHHRTGRRVRVGTGHRTGNQAEASGPAGRQAQAAGHADHEAQAASHADHEAQATGDDRQARSKARHALEWPRAGPSAAVKARLRTPAKLKDVAPATFKARFDYERRSVRRRSAPRLGAERRGSLLQPREVRLLRRRQFFRVLPGFHGAVRDQRRSVGQRRVARGQHPGRPREGKQQTGLRNFCEIGSAQLADDTDFHQFRQQLTSRRGWFRSVRRSSYQGMEVVDKINPQYRETSENQGRIQMQGNAYLSRRFRSSTTSRRRRSRNRPRPRMTTDKHG